MGMFTRTIEVSPFGKLHAEGQSKIWQNRIDIPCLGEGFELRIWGTKSGPSEAQIRAFSRLMDKASAIKADSAPKIIAFLTECAIVPQNVELSPATLWRHLAPAFIEVNAAESYCADSGQPGEIAIAIGFEIPWENEHLVFIGTIEGRVDEIYSE